MIYLIEFYFLFHFFQCRTLNFINSFRWKQYSRATGSMSWKGKYGFLLRRMSGPTRRFYNKKLRRAWTCITHEKYQICIETFSRKSSKGLRPSHEMVQHIWKLAFVSQTIQNIHYLKKKILIQIHEWWLGKNQKFYKNGWTFTKS